MRETQDLSEKSPEDTSKRNSEVVRGALDRNINQTIQQVEKPSLSGALVKLFIDFIPVLSGLQKVRQARQEFNKYPVNDSSKIAEDTREIARRRAVVGFVEVLLDSATFGATATIPDEVLTWINRLRYYIKIKHSGESLPWYGKALNVIDIPGHMAWALLKIPKMRDTVDWSLR